jgi:hypothetical protein
MLHPINEDDGKSWVPKGIEGWAGFPCPCSSPAPSMPSIPPLWILPYRICHAYVLSTRM